MNASTTPKADTLKKVTLANDDLSEDDYSSHEDYLDEKTRDFSHSELYRVPLFDGQASMMARARLPAKRFDIMVEITAVCGDGSLFSAAGSKDHVWLGFIDDKVVLRWDAGSGPTELRAGKIRTDGRSKVSARRYRKDAEVRMGFATESGSSRGRMSSVNVEPFIYIGNPPENVTK